MTLCRYDEQIRNSYRRAHGVVSVRQTVCVVPGSSGFNNDGPNDDRSNGCVRNERERPWDRGSGVSSCTGRPLSFGDDERVDSIEGGNEGTGGKEGIL